jgi:HK97 family phage major capsid protein
MSKRVEELSANVEALRTEMLALADIESPTDEQATRSTEIVAEYDAAVTSLATARELEEKATAIRTAAADPANRESGFGAPEVIIKRSPFEGVEPGVVNRMDAAEVSARALTAIESATGYVADWQERATRLIENNAEVHVTTPTEVARHALLTGSPAYHRAFLKVMQYPMDFHSMLEPEEAAAFRAALSTTGANGGYAIPFLLDPTVILSNSGAANPFRQISRIETGVSNKWNGISSAGVSAEWKSENSTAADASPTLAQPSITAYLADAFVAASFEILEDTALANSLPALFADAKDRLEDAAFATGSGSSQPKGIVTAVTAVTTSRVSPTTGGTFTTASRADVDAVIEAVPPRFRSKSSWIANYSTYGIIRRMDQYGGSSFWANLGANQPNELLGRPQYEAYSMVSTITTGSNILLAGDFSQFLIFDRIGSTMEYIPNTFDTTSGRPLGQRGWFYNWRVGSDALVPSAFRVLKL